jgi:hypothetical protein
MLLISDVNLAMGERMPIAALQAAELYISDRYGDFRDVEAWDD